VDLPDAGGPFNKISTAPTETSLRTRSVPMIQWALQIDGRVERFAPLEYGTYALRYQRRNVLAESERPGPAVSAGRGHAWHRLTSPSLRPGKLRFGLMLHFVGSAKTFRAVLP
jgi:hypothetical protein